MELKDLTPEQLNELKNAFDSAILSLIKEAQDELSFIKNEADTLRKQERELWEKQRLAVYPESSAIMEQRMILEKKIVELQNKILNQENIVFCLENGGMISAVTDKKGKEHTQIPDFRSVNTNQIYFDLETILTDKKPVYVPNIDEDNFRRRGYVFDAIRLDKDSYILAIKKHSEEEHTDYVLVTLDQLVLISDYYYTKAKAILLKEAQDKNKRSEEHWDKLPEEKRERFLNQKNLYHSLPVKVKKEITQENYEALDWKEKEKLYNFYKRYGSKKIVSKLGATQMWTSFHLMYERFIDPTAVHPKKGYGNAIVFDYWYAFSEMMKYKINDIEIQRDDLSEMRKIALETSYGESNTSDVLKQEFGILVKRQNGDKINPMEIDQIKNAFASVQNIFGNLKNIAAKQNIKISHTGVRYCFASKAIGMYVPKMGTIAVSDKYGDVQFKMTLAHETGHFIDNYIGELNKKSYASNNYESTAGKIAFVFRDNMNKPKSKHNNYVNSTQECFARAMEQYYGIEAFGDDAGIAFSYVPLDKPRPFFVADDFIGKDAYYNKLKPLIIQFFTENEDIFKYTVDVKETNEPVVIGTENENTKNITDAIEVLTVLMELSSEEQKDDLQSEIDFLKSSRNSGSDEDNAAWEKYAWTDVPEEKEKSEIPILEQKNENFKKWFGNSKVVDENGDPLVVYHGTNQDIDVFDIEKTSDYNLFGKGFYFTNSKKIAEAYIGGILDRKNEKSKVISAYLKLENPYNLEDEITNLEINEFKKLVKDNPDNFWFKSIYNGLKNDISELPNTWEKKGLYYTNINREKLTELVSFLNKNHEDWEESGVLTRNDVYDILTDSIASKQTIKDFLISKGYDGVMLNNTGTGLSNNPMSDVKHKIYVAFYPNQIKLADGTNTTFDNTNPDIRFEDGGEIYNEELKFLIEPINEIEFIGQEKGKYNPDGVSLYVNNSGSYRYVYSENGVPIAALQVMSRDGKNGVIANAYTIPLKRKQGVGRKLFNYAKNKFKTLKHSEFLSGSGKLFAENVFKNGGEITTNDDIKTVLLKRIPFLKDYNIFNHPRDKKRLEAQRVVYNENVKVMMGNDVLNFPQYNVSSEITYYPHVIGENTFHHFIIKNSFHAMQPKELDDLTFRVFIMAQKQLQEKLSYNKEIMLKTGDGIPKPELDKIINEMNGVLFEIEQFTEKHAINLFKNGGEITTNEDLYQEWKKLVNMSATELEKFKNTPEGKKAGLTKNKAKQLGISSGQEIADGIEERRSKYINRKIFEQGGEVDSPEVKLAKKVQKILQERGITKGFSTSKTDFGTSVYFYVSLYNLSEPLKIRISDHSVQNIGRIFNEEHFDASSDAIFIADMIEQNMYPDRYKDIEINRYYVDKESKETVDNNMLTDDNKNYYKKIKIIEKPETVLNNILYQDAINVKKEFIRTSQKGKDLYNISFELKLPVEEKIRYKKVRINEGTNDFHKVVKTKKLEKGGETKKVHDYCCAMLYFNNPKLSDIHNKIAEQDVYVDENDDSFGLENKPHTTLLYGLHQEVVDSDVFNTIKKHNIPSQITLENVSLFENEKYDVLKFDVNEPVLHKINKDLAKYPHTNSYPDYHPHCTIAYLKKGKGKKYCNMFNNLKITVLPEKIVYSKTDGSKITKPL